MTDRKKQTARPRKELTVKRKTLKDLEPPRDVADNARGGLSSIQSKKNGLSRTASFSKG